MSTPARIKLPLLQTPFVNPDYTLALPWYRVITQFFRLAGNSRVTLADGVYLIESGPDHIDAYSTQDDRLIGTLSIKNIPGPTPIPIDPGAVSGFEFSPSTDGTLVVFGARVELQRDAEGWVVASLIGGSFPMLVNDSARLIWYSGSPPIASYWGTA